MSTIHSRNRGFSLIELMITIAIIALIATIAFPSYNNYVIKTNRAEGKAITMQVAQTLERCFTRYASYIDEDCSIGNGDSIASENDKFDVSVASTATTFTLTSTPDRADPECTTLTLDHRGVRGHSGTGTVDDCW